MTFLFYLVFGLTFAYGQAEFVSSDYAKTLTGLSGADCVFDRTITHFDTSFVKINFYDFKDQVNISAGINVAAAAIYDYYDLDLDRDLTVFIPDYSSDVWGETSEQIRQAFKDGTNSYLIIVDYSYYTHPKKITTKHVQRSILYSYYIGKAIGVFLAGLHRNGFASENIQLLGFGLGGQIAGYAGESYLHKATEVVDKITAIDPTGPCFDASDDNNQVRAGLARYVEVYHCNSGDLGTTSVLGNADFFFNGGKDQPPCRNIKDDIDLAICSHDWCLKYYLDSVVDRKLYVARACESDAAFEAGSCEDTEAAKAGFDNSGDARGEYYICTIH